MARLGPTGGDRCVPLGTLVHMWVSEGENLPKTLPIEEIKVLCDGTGNVNPKDIQPVLSAGKSAVYPLARFVGYAQHELRRISAYDLSHQPTVTVTSFHPLMLDDLRVVAAHFVEESSEQKPTSTILTIDRSHWNNILRLGRVTENVSVPIDPSPVFTLVVGSQAVFDAFCKGTLDCKDFGLRENPTLDQATAFCNCLTNKLNKIPDLIDVIKNHIRMQVPEDIQSLLRLKNPESDYDEWQPNPFESTSELTHTIQPRIVDRTALPGLLSDEYPYLDATAASLGLSPLELVFFTVNPEEDLSSGIASGSFLIQQKLAEKLSRGMSLESVLED